MTTDWHLDQTKDFQVILKYVRGEKMIPLHQISQEEAFDGRLSKQNGTEQDAFVDKAIKFPNYKLQNLSLASLVVSSYS